jgi:hypothetical protein
MRLGSGCCMQTLQKNANSISCLQGYNDMHYCVERWLQQRADKEAELLASAKTAAALAVMVLLVNSPNAWSGPGQDWALQQPGNLRSTHPCPHPLS